MAAVEGRGEGGEKQAVKVFPLKAFKGGGLRRTLAAVGRKGGERAHAQRASVTSPSQSRRRRLLSPPLPYPTLPSPPLRLLPPSLPDILSPPGSSKRGQNSEEPNNEQVLVARA